MQLKKTLACRCNDKLRNIKCIILLAHFSSHPADTRISSAHQLIQKPFSLIRSPLAGTFSQRKTSNHFFNALLSTSYFSGFAVLAARPLSYDWKIFYLFFFQVRRVFYGTPKSEATSLLGVPSPKSLRALQLRFKELSEL